jgi:hypothetical protein
VRLRRQTDPAAASHVAPVSVWMRQPIVTGAAGRAAAAVDGDLNFPAGQGQKAYY